MRRIAPILLFLLASSAAGDNRDAVKDFERVLFPIWTDHEVPGASGSVWMAEALISNPSTQPVRVFSIVSQYGRTVGSIQPRASWSMTFIENVVFGGSDRFPGRIAYVSPNGANSLAYHDRLAKNVSNSPLPLTEIPVVRERDLHTSKITLAEVPLDPRFRLMLRVYDPFQTPGAQVVVRFWAESLLSNAGAASAYIPPVVLLGTRTLDLSVPPAAPSDPNLEPGYAQLSFDHDTFASVPPFSNSIAIDVEPIIPNLRFWAFVTATNNETQQVLTITPH